MKVKSGREDNRVVLAENHPEHPDGFAFVAGPYRNKLNPDGTAVLDESGEPVKVPNIVEVHETPRVRRLLQEGVLVKVGSTPAKTAVKSKASRGK